MIDYTYLFKEDLSITGAWHQKWDLFLSGYNSSSRVSSVYDRVTANRKVHVVHSEYGLQSKELPERNCFVHPGPTEYEFISALFDSEIRPCIAANGSLCIDITGFIRPHLMFLVALLHARGVKKFDAIYSEPSYYIHKEETRFHDGQVSGVRQVTGFEGLTNHDTSNDLVIIGAGYEDRLIKEVADQKEMARKVVLLGLPSLRADMYQQNALRTHLAADALGDIGSLKRFASASDPFVTATVLSELVDDENRNRKITNLYLSPLSTKAQALGFALYYVNELRKSFASILFPEGLSYSKETSSGLSKIWLYTIEW